MCCGHFLKKNFEKKNLKTFLLQLFLQKTNPDIKTKAKPKSGMLCISYVSRKYVILKKFFGNKNKTHKKMAVFYFRSYL